MGKNSFASAVHSFLFLTSGCQHPLLARCTTIKKFWRNFLNGKNGPFCMLSRHRKLNYVFFETFEFDNFMYPVVCVNCTKLHFSRNNKNLSSLNFDVWMRILSYHSIVDVQFQELQLVCVSYVISLNQKVNHQLMQCAV